MSTDRSDPTLSFTLKFQLTQKIHRTVPDSLSPTNPENSAAGKIIVITGGGSGIGAAAAKVWVQAGAEGVVIAGRRQNALDRTIASLRELNKGETRLLAVATDVTKAKDTDNLFAQVQETFGRPADVVFACAGMVHKMLHAHELSVDTWWQVFEVNVLGLHNTATSFIRSQQDPKKPRGTIISVNSALGGMTYPGFSSYGTSKLANHRYMEHLDVEYPTLRAFTLLPGVVATDMVDPAFMDIALDQAELSGAWALYLASPRADYLKGSLTSINWDIEEMEKHKDRIVEEGLLKNKWVQVA